MKGYSSASVWLESATGQRVPVLGRCFLGRAPSCQIVLPDVKISRQHALVQGQDENELWLIDLGSANGTYLNGRRVNQPCRLSDGDQIEVAGFKFTFHGPPPPVAALTGPAAGEATAHEIRSVTCWLLVADMEGSTKLFHKLPAEEGLRVTGLWLAACRQILEECHGTINKFLGDGFLAYWPAGPETPYWVAQALQSFKRLQEESAPPFRVVVHYARVSAGGAASLGEESLTGHEVNFVFRVEKLAAALGEARLLTEPAQAQMRLLLPTAPAGQFAVPGFEGPALLFRY